MPTTILLVDDEAGIRNVLGISLNDLGYDVLAAESGERALALFREHHPSIVVTDVKMPGMDGIELLRRIKAESDLAEVIIITGHGDMDLAIKGLKLAATDFITKPINDEALEVALQRAEERIAMRRQLREYTENLEIMVERQSARIIEVERQLAAQQVVEGLSWTMKDMARDLDNAQGAAGGIRYFNEMPCFIALYDRDKRIVATNDLYRERLGNKVGIHSWDIYAEAIEPEESCPIGRTFATGMGVRSRQIILDAHGVEIPVIVHTAPIRDNAGEVELVLEMTADITEIKRLREELRSTRAKYQQLFDEAPCYISVQDRDFNVVATNRRFKDDFGDVAGQKCYSAFRRRQAECHDCPVAMTFEDGQPHQSEMVVTSRSGQHNVLIWTAPILDADGDIVEVMEMATDITQIRTLQDRLTSLGLLIGSVSHSVKGLLTALDGGMYKLGSGIARGDTAQTEQGLDLVREMVGRIRTMVLDILYYSKERDLERRAVDAGRFAEDLVLAVEPRAKEKGVRLVMRRDPGLTTFEADPGKLASALVNILENAVDACAEADSSGIDRPFAVDLEIGADAHHVLFDIRDNGSGMDEQTRASMFTLFFSSKGSKGTGLGLFIASQIVEQHGGKIAVESEQGEGSRFLVKIPKLVGPAGGKGNI